MTYKELLRNTAIKKALAIKDINKALSGKLGFLLKAEIEKNPGSVAWLWLAKDFCETLAQNIEELMEEVGAFSPDGIEIGRIYMAYEDDDPDLYELLPTEARFFD